MALTHDQFVFGMTKLLGLPESGTCWRCPYCDSHRPSLSVRPDKGSHPIKFNCFRCSEWGDLHDILRLLYDRKDYTWRLMWVENMLEEFAQAEVALSPRGQGSYSALHQEHEYSIRIDAVMTELDKLKSPRLVKQLLSICVEHEVHPAAILARIESES